MEDDFVLLAFFVLFESFCVGVPFGFVRIMPEDVSLYFERFGVYVDHVGFEKDNVELGLSAHAEDESTYLAFHFSVLVLYVNFCKDHRDKTEVQDPLAVEDLISYKLIDRRKLARLITHYS